MSLSNVKLLEGSLLSVDVQKHEIKTTIFKRVEQLNIQNIVTYKNNIEFIKLIATLLENLVLNTKQINKNKLLFEILLAYFPDMTPAEQEVANSNLQYFLDAKLIKKVSYYQLFKTGIRELFFFKKWGKI